MVSRPTMVRNLNEQEASLATQKRSERVAEILREFHEALPANARGKRLTHEEEDELLGFGPEGV